MAAFTTPVVRDVVAAVLGRIVALHAAMGAESKALIADLEGPRKEAPLTPAAFAAAVRQIEEVISSVASIRGCPDAAELREALLILAAHVPSDLMGGDGVEPPGILLGSEARIVLDAPSPIPFGDANSNVWVRHADGSLFECPDQPGKFRVAFPRVEPSPWFDLPLARIRARGMAGATTEVMGEGGEHSVGLDPGDAESLTAGDILEFRHLGNSGEAGYFRLAMAPQRFAADRIGLAMAATDHGGVWAGAFRLQIATVDLA